MAMRMMMPEKIFSILLLVKNKLPQPENLVKQKIDDFAKSLLKRPPGESRGPEFIKKTGFRLSPE
jgi:glutathione synthase/RimK-type ligase-like ATP-grasp enzyme